MPFCQGTKHTSLLFQSCYGNRSVVSSHLLLEKIISEMLPEIHTFVNTYNYSKVINSLFKMHLFTQSVYVLSNLKKSFNNCATYHHLTIAYCSLSSDTTKSLNAGLSLQWVHMPLCWIFCITAIFCFLPLLSLY